MASNANAMGQLPSERQVAEMFQTLLGVPVEVTRQEDSSKTSAYSLSLHVDPNGSPIGAVAADLNFTAVMSVALAGQSPRESDDAIYKGSLDLDLCDNYKEVSNVMNVLFAGKTYPRVLLHSVQNVDLPVWSRLQHAHIPMVSYAIEVEGFQAGSATMALLDVPGEEELIDMVMSTGAEAAARDLQFVDGKLIRLYDFHKPKGVERNQLNALRSNLNIFTKGAAAAMTEILQSPVHIKLVQLHHQGWDDYSTNIDSNAFITTFRLDPLASQFVVTFSPGLSAKCLDSRLSGSELPTTIRRTLTDLDVTLLGPVINAVVEELSDSISQHYPVRPHIVRHVTEKFMMEGVTISLTWIVAWMAVTVAGSTFDASICFPVVPLQPVLFAMAEDAAHGVHGAGTEPDISESIPNLQVDLSVHFPSITQMMEEVANYKEGLVIPLGAQRGSKLMLTASNRPLATVKAVRMGRRLGAQITELIEDPEDFIGQLH